MSCIERVIRTMMLLLLVRLLLLVLVLVAMWLTPQTLLTHLLCSLFCIPCVQLLMSSTRASPTTRSPFWRGSSALCTNFIGRGGGLLGAASSAVTPLTSLPTAPRGRSLTPPTSTTTTTGMTPATSVRVRRSTTSGTTRRRSYRR
jgi:hypothetical protein